MAGREIGYGFTILAAVLSLTIITECKFHIVFLTGPSSARIENSNCFHKHAVYHVFAFSRKSYAPSEYLCD